PDQAISHRPPASNRSECKCHVVAPSARFARYVRLELILPASRATPRPFQTPARHERTQGIQRDERVRKERCRRPPNQSSTTFGRYSPASGGARSGLGDQSDKRQLNNE